MQRRNFNKTTGLSVAAISLAVPGIAKSFMADKTNKELEYYDELSSA